MKLVQLALTKKVLQWGWLKFILLMLASFLAIVLVFTPLFYWAEPLARRFSDALAIGFFIPLGMSPSMEFSSAGRALVVAEGLLSTIWFAVVTAFIVARISNPRTNAHCIPVVALWHGKLKKEDPGGSEHYVLEFRLLVYPSPPLIAPEITVSYYYFNDQGERETIPLELDPVQAALVRYYLVFCAIVPQKLLTAVSKANLKDKLPQGAVEVLIRAVDSQSDGTINILHQYSIPKDVKEGSFEDAIILDANKNIVGVRKESLAEVKKWSGY